jgi:hypothetical protein
MRAQLRWLLSVLSICSIATPAIAQHYLSIESDPAYLLQRNCVRSCIVWLPYRLDCPEKYTNECFCRADLKSKASSTITGCVNTGCSPSATADLSNAISVYDGYCAIPTVVTTPASVPAGSTQNSQVTTVTSLTLATATSVGKSGTGPITPPPTGEFLVLFIGAFLAGEVLLWWIVSCKSVFVVPSRQLLICRHRCKYCHSTIDSDSSSGGDNDFNTNWERWVWIEWFGQDCAWCRNRCWAPCRDRRDLYMRITVLETLGQASPNLACRFIVTFELSLASYW